MVDKRAVDELSIEELEQVLAVRKREKRLRRLRRMKADGRLVGVTPRESPTPPPLPRPVVEPAGATARYRSTPVEEKESWLAGRVHLPRIRIRLPSLNLSWVSNRFLLFVEIIAILGLAWLLWDAWELRQTLNREVSQVQQEIIDEAFPTPDPTPLINVVLLPGGHTSPIAEGGARQGEAGVIPEHLLPRINAYQPPPIPTPGPEQPRRLVIPDIDVDHPIVAGDTWEQLKKGVGHHVNSANPGEVGNMVLTAHNDIYGEIFRRLNQLQVGDEIIVYTQSRKYVYTVQSQQVIEPTEVRVLEPTRNAAITLISCYPYLVDTQRIVIIGALKAEL